MIFFDTVLDESLSIWSSMFGSFTDTATLEFIGKLILAVVGLIVARIIVIIIIKVVKKLLRRNKKMTDLMRKFIGSIIDVVGWIIILIMFIQSLGINIAPIVAGLGVSGVILGLAFQETLTNIFSGVLVILNKPFDIGDYIECGSTSGTVVQMEILITSLQTPDNRKITLLNSVIWANPIINYSNMKHRRLDAVASVAYGTDIDLAKKVLTDLVLSYPEVLETPVPTIEVDTLGASSIDLIVRPWVCPKDYWPVKWRMQADIVKTLNKNNISIPFPQMDIHMDK